ncbi:MAG TPA: hypothetical protein VK053_00685 [Jiangellaceae bacterium]|nr:hypothetical protein [Jiangellaceae bacterium]
MVGRGQLDEPARHLLRVDGLEPKSAGYRYDGQFRNFLGYFWAARVHGTGRLAASSTAGRSPPLHGRSSMRWWPFSTQRVLSVMVFTVTSSKVVAIDVLVDPDR